MKRVSNIWIIAVAALVFGCSGDINRSSSPVELVVTNTQNLNRFDRRSLYRIVVDDVSDRKDYRYLTVVADHDRGGAVVWAPRAGVRPP